MALELKLVANTNKELDLLMEQRVGEILHAISLIKKNDKDMKNIRIFRMKRNFGKKRSLVYGKNRETSLPFFPDTVKTLDESAIEDKMK